MALNTGMIKRPAEEGLVTKPFLTAVEPGNKLPTTQEILKAHNVRPTLPGQLVGSSGQGRHRSLALVLTIRESKETLGIPTHNLSVLVFRQLG